MVAPILPTSVPAATLRLAVATCDAIPGIHADDAPLHAALAARGVDAVPCIWSDPAIDWASFDAVLIRTTWDYFQRYAEFMAWLDRLPVPTINDRALLRWNSNKRYFLDLRRRGIDTVVMQLVPGKRLGQFHDSMMLACEGWEVVVKPTISGGAWHTLRGVIGDPEFAAAVARLPVEFDYLAQNFMPEVMTEGEWSLLYFDREFSHAVLKRPASGDFRVQAQFGGSEEARDPGPDILASADFVLRAAAACGYPDHAYARVDGVVVGGRFMLMELEMIEPHLFFAHRPAAAQRLAEGLLRRLQSLRAARTG
jgi:glutathione synthase/RimK-type ligase-like ATP-grasp enzyme